MFSWCRAARRVLDLSPITSIAFAASNPSPFRRLGSAAVERLRPAPRHRAGLVFLAARRRSILPACTASLSTIQASMLSEPNPALGGTRGAAFPLRVAFRRAPHSSNVGRHAERELKRLAGRLYRFVPPDRRFPSAARVGDVPSAQLVSRCSSFFLPVAGGQCRVRAHRSGSGQMCSWQDHPAVSTSTPAPCGVGVSRSAQSQYSSGMRSLAFHHPGFNPVRAQPGARADARSSVSSTGGVPSRAAQLKRWASRRTRAEALGR